MNKFRLDKVQRKFERLKVDLPKVLANQSQEFFVKSFKQEGFNNAGAIVPWPEVKRRIPGTREYRYPKGKGLGRRTRKILVGSGRLRREAGNSIRSATFNLVKLAVAAPYAAVHNNGTSTIPRRRFMAQSRLLIGMHRKVIGKAIDNCFK